MAEANQVQESNLDNVPCQLAKNQNRGRMKKEVRGCIVPGCEVTDDDLVNKARVCKPHQRALELDFNGVKKRFCQQCVRLHNLDRFHGNNRGCVARLKRQSIRERRRRADRRLKNGEAVGPPRLPKKRKRKAAKKETLDVMTGTDASFAGGSAANDGSTGCYSDSVTESNNNASLLPVKHSASTASKRRRSNEETSTEQTVMNVTNPIAGGPLPDASGPQEQQNAPSVQNKDTTGASHMSEPVGSAIESSPKMRLHNRIQTETFEQTISPATTTTGFAGASGDQPAAQQRGYGMNEWGMWHQYANYQGMMPNWTAATWHDKDGQEIGSGLNNGPQNYELSQEEDNVQSGELGVVGHEDGQAISIPDEWKENPAKMIMMGVEAPWNLPEERKAYELPEDIDYECAYIEGQIFGNRWMPEPDASNVDAGQHGGFTMGTDNMAAMQTMMPSGAQWPMGNDVMHYYQGFGYNYDPMIADSQDQMAHNWMQQPYALDGDSGAVPSMATSRFQLHGVAGDVSVPAATNQASASFARFQQQQDLPPELFGTQPGARVSKPFSHPKDWSRFS